MVAQKLLIDLHIKPADRDPPAPFKTFPWTTEPRSCDYRAGERRSSRAGSVVPLRWGQRCTS